MKSPYDIVLYPLFTEKSSSQRAMLNKVSFIVASNANKIEIKEAVEKLFDVSGGVASVRTQNVRGKVKRHGRSFGKRPNWKKAIITLREDHSIEFFDS